MLLFRKILSTYYMDDPKPNSSTKVFTKFYVQNHCYMIRSWLYTTKNVVFYLKIYLVDVNYSLEGYLNLTFLFYPPINLFPYFEKKYHSFFLGRPSTRTLPLRSSCLSY